MRCVTDSLEDPCSLRAIDAVHHELAELFLEHQERLLVFDLEWAERILLQYDKALRLHIRHEEELLLPVYDRADLPRRARAQVYSHEHAWILGRLDELRARLRDLRLRQSLKPRRVISLLERETTFKHFLHHHEQRENEFLFPILDGRLPRDERMDLLCRCEREWRQAGMPRGRYLRERSAPAPGRARRAGEDDSPAAENLP
jgi:hypothetical protein